MKKFILIVAAMFGMAIAASAANYTVNDSEIDAVIENAVEAPSTVNLAAALPAAPAPAPASVSGKSDAAAIALCFFFGPIGIHRHYMGTAPLMWAAYLFTCGGIFGVVPTIDFIVMLVNVVEEKGLGNFYGNRKFFMWA